jgi:hypothetical protein
MLLNTKAPNELQQLNEGHNMGLAEKLLSLELTSPTEVLDIKYHKLPHGTKYI